MEEQPIGKITHFFSKISVAVVALTDKVKIGDTLHVKGAHADFEQKLDSMQVDHKTVTEAAAGQSIGLKTLEPVHQGDMVFKIIS
jgi:hypothetical protein